MSTGEALDRLDLARPDLGEDEEALVLEVLRSGRLSLGPMLDRFEEAFGEWLGVSGVVATSSGTTALHLGVRALGWKAGDSVVLSPFTFVASANALLYEGVRPVFADVDRETLNLDPVTASSAVAEDTVGMLPIDIFGLPADLAGFEEAAGRQGLGLLEDGAQALGAYDSDGKRIGSRSHPTTFAFYANKQMTTGEGGVLVCPDPAMADLARSERNQGRSPDMTRMDHRGLGFNYRMSEVAAAIGLAQLRRIEAILSRRADVAAQYHDALAGTTGLDLPSDGHLGSVRSWFIYPVRLPEGSDRDRIIDRLEAVGIPTRPYLPCVHTFPQFAEFGYGPGDFPIAEGESARSLALPFHGSLTGSDVERVAAALRSALDA